MAWHRWLGIGTITLIVSHIILTTTGWAMSSGSSVIGEFLALNEIWDILIATVGTVLLVLVAVTSIRAIRRRLSYETWYGLHLYAYIGIALSFLHQVTMGADFIVRCRRHGSRVCAGWMRCPATPLPASLTMPG